MDVAIDRTDAHTGMGDRPYEALGFAVVEQAVEDAKELIREGIIANGKVIAVWPITTAPSGRQRPKKYLNHYDTRAKAEELLRFFTHGGLESTLACLQSGLDHKRVCKTIGI